MVSYYGMSEKLGNLSFYDAEGYGFNKPYSEKTAELIDKEVKAIVDEVTQTTTKLIKANWDKLEQIAQLLIDKEVIMSEDIEAVLGPKAGVHGEERLKNE